MKWYYVVLIQAVLHVISLTIQILSSLIASVIFHQHPKPIIAAFEWIKQNTRRIWLTRILRLSGLMFRIIERIRLSMSSLDLSLKAFVRSRESIVLVVWGVLPVLIFPLLLTVLTHLRYSTSTDGSMVIGGLWTYRVSPGDMDGFITFTLERRGVELFSTSTRYATLVQFDADGSTREISLDYHSNFVGTLDTKDISGDQIPDILLTEDCGCSSGFIEYRLFSLGTEIREEINTTSRSVWTFKDLDGDKIPEIVTEERIVDDLGSYSDLITTVEVILNYDNGKLRLANHLMRRPPPTKAEFYAKILEDKVKSKSEEGLGIDDAYVARLVFSGNGELARQYLNFVMSGEAKNGVGFYWSNFYGAMMGSDYWEQVASLNNWTVDQYAFKYCPY